MGSWSRAIALVAIMSSSLACEIYAGGTKGQSGELTFYEPNRYPADELVSAQAFELPVALGARTDVWTRSPGLSTLESAEIDDRRILSLTSNGYPIRLRAESEGVTTLRVRTSSASDSLPLTVVRPDGARVWVLSPTFAPFGSYGPPYVLRPSAVLRVGAQPMAADQPLLGFDLLEWEIDAVRGGNTVELRACPGTGVISFSYLGAELSVPIEVTPTVADDACP